MNKTAGIIVLVIVVAGGAYLLMRAPKTADNGYKSPTPTQTVTTTAPASTQGRVIVSMTDAAADLNSISEINATIGRIEAHSAADGWVTISTTPRTYNLLDLKARNENAFLADSGIKAGTYDQVRLNVDRIVVKTKAGATSDAKVPSGSIRMDTMLMVKKGSVSSLNFDFMADKSLHRTGDGDYIFAPVVKSESRSEANVTVDSGSKVSIGEGKVDDSDTVGMDIDGTVKANFQLDSKIKLDVSDGVIIKL